MELEKLKAKLNEITDDLMCLAVEQRDQDQEVSYQAFYMSEIIRRAAENLQQDPVEAEMEGGGSTWWYVCGECHTSIDTRDKFCRECGRRINWGTMKAKGGVKNVKETDGAE